MRKGRNFSNSGNRKTKEQLFVKTINRKQTLRGTTGKRKAS